MAARLTECRRLQRRLATILAALAVWAAVGGDARAETFRDLYAEGLRAQEAGRFEAAADRYERASRLAPTNTEVLRRLALVRGYQRDYDGALAALGRGLAIDPNSTDLRLTQSRILGWAGRNREARTVVDAVIAEHPRDAEAHSVKGRIEYYGGRFEVAEASFRRALEIDPANTEAAAGLADIEKARQATGSGKPVAAGKPASWRVDTGYSRSRISRPSGDDWNEGFIRLERATPAGTALSLRLDVSSRFSSTDTSAGIGVAHVFSPALRGYLEAAVSPGADFLPRREYGAGGGVRLYGGTGPIGPGVVTLDLRQRQYAGIETRNADPGFQQYFFDGRLGLTGKWINTFDRASHIRLAGWYGRVDWQVLPAFRLFGGASEAPETDAGVTVDTSSRFGGLAYDFTPQVGIRLDVGREDRENAYVRDSVAVGLVLRRQPGADSR